MLKDRSALQRLVAEKQRDIQRHASDSVIPMDRNRLAFHKKDGWIFGSHRHAAGEQ